MPRDDQIAGYLSILPTEILLYIFTFLPGRQLTRCRQVCLRWRGIIDELIRSDGLWMRHCMKDFSKVFHAARYKARADLLWFHIYRSLALWPRISRAREVRDEFAYAADITEEVKNLVVLQNGIIGVHKRSSIVYYDLNVLEPLEHGSVGGDYMNYKENDHTIVIASYHYRLFILRKLMQDPSYEASVTIDRVRYFILVDRDVFYVDLNNQIFVCSLRDRDLHSTLLTHCAESILSLGYSNNHLNILTFQRKIYSVINKSLVLSCCLEDCTNCVHQIYHYNLLEQLDWTIYLQWMCGLGRNIPVGPLRDIKIVRAYGDVVFVGCNWGVLLVYNAPFTNGEFDFFDAEPVKQFNFMERIDCPVLGMCPIIAIDVVETEYGHTLLVGMPKKIAVVDLVHSFERTSSVAMLPYRPVHKVTFLNLEEDV